ncbi:uncharacterized protein LOC133737056 [Rosa rugosa]|uniref:uncharacterized protein LOC133737056 n=1 Tax=Rosa rugosa TaxID=74645 RepID=UPI002B414679|nr:uncharacterized protein LOC133737056 [Rosa rugosa]
MGGVGVIIRDSEGSCMGGMFQHIENVYSPEQIEAVAGRIAVRSITSTYGRHYKDISEGLSSIPGAMLGHISRDGNAIAHSSCIQGGNIELPGTQTLQSCNISKGQNAHFGPKHKRFTPQFHCAKATRRNPNYPPGGADSFVDDPRNWSRSINSEIDRPYGFEDDDEDEEDGDDDDEEDRSLDLLVRFVQNVFKKVSKRARRAVRSVLPVAIPTKLVGFSVNGVLILAFLWVLKAFLEVMHSIFYVFGC